LSHREKKNKTKIGGDTLLKEAIGTGASIEEAQAAAIARLSAPEEADVTIEVVEIPVKKTLGIFGGTLAKVKAYYEEADYLQAEQYITTILNGMGIKGVTLSVKEIEDDIHIQIDCDDNSAIIGHRGETLDSIQYLTRLVISKKSDGYKRVLVNAGNYREKREGTLREIARKNAEKVKKYGSKMFLDPMNPYERRIIHTTIQDIDGVDSHSVGTDNDRRVVISLTDGYKAAGRDIQSNRIPREGIDSNTDATVDIGSHDQVPDSKPALPAGEKAGKVRVPRSDVTDAARYGKIEPKKK
jgi:spoIIIJ-associated protein